MKHIQLHRTKPARSSEYQNLRHVVPSLRRQRDVDKLEVVTEAARYIDQLHKTLIERFVLCGIPDSLKEILGTDNANELGSQHIMNLVANMATTQRQQVVGEQQQQQQQLHRDPTQRQRRRQNSHPAMIATTSARHRPRSGPNKRTNLGKLAQPIHSRRRHIPSWPAAPSLTAPSRMMPLPTSGPKHLCPAKLSSRPLPTMARPLRSPTAVAYHQTVHKAKSRHLENSDDDDNNEKK